MKPIKHLKTTTLTAIAISIFLGCSNDLAGVTEDSNTMQKNIAENHMSDTANVAVTDSIDDDYGHNIRCRPQPSLKRPDSQNDIITEIIKDREKILIKNGVDEKNAKDSATNELLRELGLDTLIASDSSISMADISENLEYFLIDDGVDSTLFIKTKEDFTKDGKLEQLDFCHTFKYEDLKNEILVMYPLCGDKGPSYYERIANISHKFQVNIRRKCIDIPYCDNSKIGEIIYAGNEDFLIPVQRYECNEFGWQAYTDTTSLLDIPCDTNNKRTASPIYPGSTREFYVCYEGKWYPSYQWSAELPAEYYFNQNMEYGTFQDPRDSTTYKTIEINGKTWMAENMRYYDSTFKPTGACPDDSCKIGGLLYKAADAFNVCPEGWTLPTEEDLLKLGEPDNDYTRHFSQIGGLPNSSNKISATNESGLTLVIHPYIAYKKYGLRWGLYTANISDSGEIRIGNGPIPVIDPFDLEGAYAIRCVKE